MDLRCSGGEERGEHAHKKLQQFIIETSGSFDVIIGESKEKHILSIITVAHPQKIFEFLQKVGKFVQNSTEMTTLKITVDNKKNAKLLTRLLKNMNFVKKIEEENSFVKDQYVTLRKFFTSVESNHLFSKINDPVVWQKEIRDEWETC